MTTDNSVYLFSFPPYAFQNSKDDNSQLCLLLTLSQVINFRDKYHPPISTTD